MATSLVPAGAIVTLAVLAVVAWSRRRFVPRLLVVALGQLLALSAVITLNNWPTLVANLSATCQPYGLQVGASSAPVASRCSSRARYRRSSSARSRSPSVAADAYPSRSRSASGSRRAFSVPASWSSPPRLRTPVWAGARPRSRRSAAQPILTVTLSPLTALLTRMALVMGVLALVGRHASGRRWSGAIEIAHRRGRRRAADGIGPRPVALAVGLCGLALSIVSAWLFSLDLTIVPIALGVVAAVEAVLVGLGRAYPGAAAYGGLAALAVLGVSWRWFRTLRRSADRLPPDPAASVAA